MGFMTDWKAAKKAFEESTKKSKPSETFLGVFNKGTGIESALKDADGAKTAGDLRKAIEKFSTAVDNYMPTLKKSANDPKSVPEDKKAAYTTAIKKLSEALEAIKTSATEVAASLDGSGKKESVDTGQLKQAAEDKLRKELEDEAEEHYQLRLEAVVEAKKIIKSFKAAADAVQKLVAMSEKARDTALGDKRDGNKMGSMVQLGVISKCLDQSGQIRKSVQDSYDANVQSASSTIKRSRSDFAKKDKLSEEFRKPYMTKSVKAFGEGTDLATEINDTKASVQKLCDQIEALHNEAEAIADQVQPAEVYVERLTKVLGGLKKVAADITLANNRVVGMASQAQDDSATAESRLKSIPGWQSRVDQYENELTTRLQVGSQLKSQATKLPRSARENNAVDQLAVQVLAQADEMDKAAKTLTDSITSVRKALTDQQEKLAA